MRPALRKDPVAIIRPCVKEACCKYSDSGAVSLYSLHALSLLFSLHPPPPTPSWCLTPLNGFIVPECVTGLLERKRKKKEKEKRDLRWRDGERNGGRRDEWTDLCTSVTAGLQNHVLLFSKS